MLTQSSRSVFPKRRRINHVKIRFRIMKWSILLIGVSLPVTTWFVAADFFQLSRMNSLWAVLAAGVVMAGMLRLFTNYAAEGFARSYANGGTWDYLVSRFEIEARPARIDSKDIFSGPSQLDRRDVTFSAEVGISNIGMYININALGRILVPWDSISVLRKYRIPTEDGWQQMVSLGLDGPEVDLNIPWLTRLDELVPKSVGIT